MAILYRKNKNFKIVFFEVDNHKDIDSSIEKEVYKIQEQYSHSDIDIVDIDIVYRSKSDSYIINVAVAIV